MTRTDLTGQRFTRLTVLSYEGTNKNHHSKWKCICDCGETVISDIGSLRAGRTKSCGCLTRYKGENRMRNGEYTHPLYKLWSGIKHRCSNKNLKKAHIYAKKGITVCERWNDFKKFVEDMGPRPPGTSIDRIDGSKGYSPENCRWATPKQQANNTAANRLLSANGSQKTVAQWSEQTGIKSNTIIYRLKRGWSDFDAVTVPVFSKYAPPRISQAVQDHGY